MMSNELVPIGDIERMAIAIAKSGLFGIKTLEQAIALMLIAQAEGMHPASAARDYHVIQGRPALKADAMLARFQTAGGKVSWTSYTDENVTGVFSHPAGGSVEIVWTMKQAKSIGLGGKDNWKNYPRAMLRARCISEGIRTVFPACVAGVYSIEEVQDFEPQKPPPVKDMGKVVPVVDKPLVEVLEAPAPADEDIPGIPIYVPGMEEPFSTHPTEHDWIENYAALVVRIQASKKFTDDQKVEKLGNLRAVNADQLAIMSSMDRLKLNAAISAAGGTPERFPKQSKGEFEEMEFQLMEQQNNTRHRDEE
jgi:hypothetical protein